MGVGAAAIYNLMEDATQLKFSRTQLWFWLHKEVTLENGENVILELYQQYTSEES